MEHLPQEIEDLLLGMIIEGLPQRIRDFLLRGNMEGLPEGIEDLLLGMSIEELPWRIGDLLLRGNMEGLPQGGCPATTSNEQDHRLAIHKGQDVSRRYDTVQRSRQHRVLKEHVW